MNEIINELSNQILTFQSLGDYLLEFGVFEEDSWKRVRVNILNADSTTTIIDMSIGEIMYFTEYGTLTIPAKPILEIILGWVNTPLDLIIDTIFDGVFNKNWTKKDIEEELNIFIIRANTYIKGFVKTFDDNNFLSNLLGNNKELYNLIDLSKYINIKLIKK